MAAFWLRILVLAAGMTLVGCGGYRNISDARPDMADNDANTKTAKAVMAEGLRSTIDKWGHIEGYVFVLPKNAKYQTYQDIYVAVGQGALLEADTGLPVLKIEEARVRGWKAEVDVSRPVNAVYPDGPRQLVTVYMEHDPMSGWMTTYVKTWRPGVGDLNEEVLAVDIEALRLEQYPDEQEPLEGETPEMQQPGEDAEQPMEEPKAAEEAAAATE